MSSKGIARVRYFDRQILRLAEVTDEQNYHLSMMRRHNISAHIWGIVYGLELTQSKEGSLSVQPGLAVDGYGRVLVLPAARGINPAEFESRLTDVLDVWLVYNQQPSDPAASGFAECGVEGQNQRLQEIAMVILRVPSGGAVASSMGGSDRRQPENLSPAELAFNPTENPPDAPERPWPVYLGQIQRLTGNPVTYTVDSGGRPYAGLVGEWLRAPSGRAWMQIGAEVKDDPYRFAVYLPETSQDRGQPYPPPGLLPRLALRDNGKVEIRGDTTVDGSITLNGGALEFGNGPATIGPLPWSMYHVKAETDEHVGEIDQLRIEIPEPSDAQTPDGLVVVGYFSTQKKKFIPCLTIDNLCNVRVHGNLIAAGGCSENPDEGKSAARTVYRPAAPPAGSVPAAGTADAAARMRELASQLKAAGLVPQFLALLQSDPDLQDTIDAFRIDKEGGVGEAAGAGRATGAKSPAKAASPSAKVTGAGTSPARAGKKPPAKPEAKPRPAKRPGGRKPPAQEGGG